MSSLPFPRFPLLCQLLVIKNVEFLDLLKLSTCSRKIHILIPHANISLLNLSVVLAEERVDLYFTFPVRQRIFSIAIPLDLKGFLGGNWVSDKVQDDGSVWFSLNMPYGEKEFAAKVEKMVNFLMELFGRTKLNQLEFKPSKETRKLVERVVKKHWKTTEILKITEKPGKPEDSNDSEESKPLSEEEVNWSLSALTVTESIFVTSKVLPDVQWTQEFNCKKVEIEKPSWIHLDSIINSTTERFDFLGLHPSNYVLNTILKAWISGEKLLNLKVVYWESDWENAVHFPVGFENEVMEGIEEAVLTSEEKILNPFESEDEEEDGKHVRRSDGKLAVVAMSWWIFYFRVC